MAITGALLSLQPHAGARADPVAVVSQASASEPNATRYLLHSERLGRDFAIVVHTPNTAVFLPGQKLAAVYALDGGYDLVGPQSQFLAARDVMAPAIVVGIDYPPGQAQHRAADLAHNRFTVAGETLGGGGGAFEAFLLDDLRPFIEARYPADPRSSILFGHSMGAVFAANLFARNPDAFAGYILGSFVEPRDPGVVARVAKAAARTRGKRAFLAVGGSEDGATAERRRMRQGFGRLSSAFAAKPGIAFRAKAYPGENHLSYYPALVIDGLRFVLPPSVPVDLPYTPLSATDLARYGGDYQLPDGRRLSVRSARDNLLSAQVGDGPLTYLLPNGRDRYYAYGADLDVRFEASALTLTGRAAPLMRAPKLAP